LPSRQSVDQDSDHLSSVFNVKRLIGRKFSNPEVQSSIEHFPFKVVDKDGEPYIRVQYRGEGEEFVSSVTSQPDLLTILALFLVLVS